MVDFVKWVFELGIGPISGFITVVAYIGDKIRRKKEKSKFQYREMLELERDINEEIRMIKERDKERHLSSRGDIENKIRVELLNNLMKNIKAKEALKKIKAEKERSVVKSINLNLSKDEIIISKTDRFHLNRVCETIEALNELQTIAKESFVNEIQGWVNISEEVQLISTLRFELREEDLKQVIELRKNLYEYGLYLRLKRA